MVIVANKRHPGGIPFLDKEVRAGTYIVGQFARYAARDKPPTAITHARSDLHYAVAAVARDQRAGIGVAWITHRVGKLEPVGLLPGHPSQNNMRNRA